MLLFVVLLVYVIPCVTCNASNGTQSPLNVTTTCPPSSNARVNVTVTPIPCVHQCSCYDNVTVRCLISQLTSEWQLPARFKYLDLSYNGLFEVPTEFFKGQDLSNLRSLSLRRNNLTIIPDNVFVGLENLERLDLSFVNLQEWRGNISRSLPSLKYLDVTGNSPWIPSNNVLDMKSLRKIQGVSWSSQCFNCTLINTLYIQSSMGNKSASESSVVPPVPTEMVAPSNESRPTQSSVAMLQGPPMVMMPQSTGINLANKFMEHNFFPQCQHVPIPMMCAPSFIRRPTNKHDVLTLPSRLFNVAYVLGALAIVLNLAIILIYIYSTNIRKINSMLLISNMAFCDILVGVYAIIIAKVNIFNALLNQELIVGGTVTVSKLCQVASILFTVGQSVSVITALLLTIDKFLSIVYCMDPNRKLSRRLSLLVLILCWIGVLVFAFTPHFIDSLKYSPTLMCTLPGNQKKSISYVASFSILVALYLANIPLYVKIFVFVRRSSVRMGVRRDAVLAKKIALLVFTNFVFFAVPMIVIIVFTFVLGIHYTMNLSHQASEVRFVVVYFMPVICLCFNSCLNPFLCAFRQRQFRREFKKCVRNCILSRMCKAFTTFRSDSSVRTTQPTRVEMYKLSNIDSQVQTL